MIGGLRFFLALSGLALAATFSSCSLVDADLDNCDREFHLDYQLRLVTNITTELQTELALQQDQDVRSLLEDYLKDIFKDYARDVDLSFYNVESPMAREVHIPKEMNGSETSYVLTLPVQDYRHLAVANIASNKDVVLEGDENCASSSLVQQSQEGIANAHKTGLFTARADMSILSGTSQSFDVTLYMTNAASALVLDMSEAGPIQDLVVRLEGMADSFNISDSTFVFSGKDNVSTDLLQTQDGKTRCYASVHFPSPNLPGSKVIIDDGGGLDGNLSSNPLWKWKVYSKMPDGTIVESLLNIYTPLLAGHIKVLKAKVMDNGVVYADDFGVGVSVTLDWKGGGTYPVYF